VVLQKPSDRVSIERLTPDQVHPRRSYDLHESASSSY
jgi:hypothetical protein